MLWPDLITCKVHNKLVLVRSRNLNDVLLCMGHDINICALCDENTVIHNQVKFAKKKTVAAMSIYNTKIKTANNKLGWN